MSDLRLILAVLSFGFSSFYWAQFWRASVGASTQVESFGAGLVLSMSCSIVLSQILPFPVLQFFAFMIVSFAVPRVFKSGTKLPLENGAILSILLGLVTALPALVRFWIEHSSYKHFARNFFIDMPFFEVLSRSVYLFGGDDSLFIAGEGIRYHWLTFAWIGAQDSWFALAPFEALIYISPVVAVVSAGLMSAAITMRFSASRSAILLSVALAVGSGSFFRTGVGSLVPHTSPSHSLSVSWLLFAILIVLRFQDFAISRCLLLVGLAVISFMTTGGKVSHGIVLIGSVLNLAMAQVIFHRFSRGAIQIVLAVAFGSGAAYIFLIRGAGSGGLAFGIGDAAGLPLIFLPIWFMARVAGWLPRVAPSVLIQELKDVAFSKDAFALVAGSVCVGAVAFLGSSHVGGSHMFFVLSATSVAVPFSAIGVSKVLSRASKGDLWRLAIGIAIGTIVYLCWITYGVGFALMIAKRFPLQATQVQPNLAGLVVVSALLVFVRWQRARFSERFATGRFECLKIIAVLAALTSCSIGPVTETQMILRFVSSDDSAHNTAWSKASNEGAEWLQAQRTLEGELILTNRFCVDDAAEPPDCGGPWGAAYFWVGAISRKQMFVEGYEYVHGVQSEDVPNRTLLRIELSRKFAESPDMVTHSRLWDLGVRWVWLDLTQPSANDWTGIGVVEFENQAVRVVRLIDPAG